MGQALSRVKDKFRVRKLLILGREGVGKSTLLSNFRMGHPVLVQPTNSFECVSIKGWSVFDLGGNAKNMPLWHYFYPNTDCIMWVISSEADPDEEMDLLYDILEKNKVLDDVPLILILNQFEKKRDLQEITSKLKQRATRILSIDARKDYARIAEPLLWAKNF